MGSFLLQASTEFLQILVGGLLEELQFVKAGFLLPQGCLQGLDLLSRGVPLGVALRVFLGVLGDHNAAHLGVLQGCLQSILLRSGDLDLALQKRNPLCNIRGGCQ